ncbi:MAG: hypothetical protein ACJATT_003592 [Myxococcota bacterium]|jgi:hypothetical protein
MGCVSFPVWMPSWGPSRWGSTVIGLSGGEDHAHRAAVVANIIFVVGTGASDWLLPVSHGHVNGWEDLVCRTVVLCGR